MESYLREKKEAILDDRKNFGGEHINLQKKMLSASFSNDIDNDDQKSCL